MPYGFNKSITVQAGQVPSTQTNFPVLISGTYTYLKTAGNGGNVQSANGYDIIFTSDAAGSTPLNFERVAWNGSTGDVQFWVLIPSLTSSTVFYLWYGNSAITTDQQNKSGTWNANYKGVYHWDAAGGGVNGDDSTASPNGFGPYNTAAGKIGQGAPFVAASLNWANASDSKLPTGANPFTVELWAKWGNTGLNGVLLAYGGAGASYANACYIQYSAGTLYGGFFPGLQASFTPVSGTWYHVALTYDGTTLRYYVNATPTSPASATATMAVNLNFLRLGAETWSTGAPPLQFFFDGTLDEVRISNVQRSADWITTSYNNQNAPSSFYVIGGSGGGGGATGGVLGGPPGFSWFGRN